MSLRGTKIAKEILNEIGLVISSELKDPDIGLVSLTRVKVSDDLRKVTLFITMQGNEKTKAKTIAGLKRSKGFIRSQIAERVNMRRVPEVEFELDTSSESIENTLKLIKSLEKGKDLEK